MKNKLTLLAIITLTLWLITYVYHAMLSGSNPLLTVIVLLTSIALIIVGSIYGCRWIANKFVRSDRSVTIQLIVFEVVLILILSTHALVFGSGAELDIQLHDTYFVFAQYHALIVLALVLSFCAFVYYLLQKVTGKKINEAMGQLHFWLTTMGFMLLLFPFSIMGSWPRRYYSFDNYEPFKFAQDVARIMLIFIVVAQLFFVINVIITLLRRRN